MPDPEVANKVDMNSAESRPIHMVEQVGNQAPRRSTRIKKPKKLEFTPDAQNPKIPLKHSSKVLSHELHRDDSTKGSSNALPCTLTKNGHHHPQCKACNGKRNATQEPPQTEAPRGLLQFPYPDNAEWQSESMAYRSIQTRNPFLGSPFASLTQEMTSHMKHSGYGLRSRTHGGAWGITCTTGGGSGGYTPERYRSGSARIGDRKSLVFVQLRDETCLPVSKTDAISPPETLAEVALVGQHLQKGKQQPFDTLAQDPLDHGHWETDEHGYSKFHPPKWRGANKFAEISLRYRSIFDLKDEEMDSLEERHIISEGCHDECPTRSKSGSTYHSYLEYETATRPSGVEIVAENGPRKRLCPMHTVLSEPVAVRLGFIQDMELYTSMNPGQCLELANFLQRRRQMFEAHSASATSESFGYNSGLPHNESHWIAESSIGQLCPVITFGSSLKQVLKPIAKRLSFAEPVQKWDPDETECESGNDRSDGGTDPENEQEVGIDGAEDDAIHIHAAAILMSSSPEQQSTSATQDVPVEDMQRIVQEDLPRQLQQHDTCRTASDADLETGQAERPRKRIRNVSRGRERVFFEPESLPYGDPQASGQDENGCINANSKRVLFTESMLNELLPKGLRGG